MPQTNLDPSELEIEHEFGLLLLKLQKKINISYSQNRYGDDVPDLIFKKGRVYWKLIKEYTNSRNGHHSCVVYAFVRRKDGAILRAASWQGPETRTKNPVAGYITDEWAPDYFTAYGVGYAPQI